MPELPDVAAFELAPDWVCEVLSPSTQSHDRVKKMRVYAREGVGYVWLIDPSAQTLEVYTAANGAWLRSQTAQADEKIRSEPFADLELDLAIFWER
jgi:Uma2 family endonuclease